MSNQQELTDTSDLILLETIIQSVQEIDQPQPDRNHAQSTAQSSNNYGPNSATQVPYNELLPAEEVIANRQMIKDFLSAILTSFPKRVVLGVAAVILGTLIGLITPWLTAIF